MAKWSKAADCKSAIPRFESGRRLSVSTYWRWVWGENSAASDVAESEVLPKVLPHCLLMNEVQTKDDFLENPAECIVDKDEKILAEYKEAVTAYRFASAMFIGELTVYLAASGALVNAIGSEPARPIIVVPAVIGIILTLAFWVITHRAGDFYHAARRRAIKLEDKLGFRIHSRGPIKRRLLTATNAIHLIYLTGLVCWIAVLVAG